MKFALLLALASGACTFTSRNVNVGQVPHAAMPFATAAPTTGIADLTAGVTVPTVSIGWTATVMHWTVPYDQYSMVSLDIAGHPIGVGNVQSSDTGSTTTLGLGIWPSWRRGQLRMFGGGYVTQRPTVKLVTTDTTYIDPTVIRTDSEDVIDNDKMDVLFGAGVEYEYQQLSLMAMISQEVAGSVMRSGPSVQLAVSVRLGERASDRKRASSAPPPAPAPTLGPPSTVPASP